MTRGVGFEPTSSSEHGISNPTPYQARRPPLLYQSEISKYILIILSKRSQSPECNDFLYLELNMIALPPPICYEESLKVSYRIKRL
jgi:hypothetical protein